MRGRFYLFSPFGAALALICFFLPWGRVGCMGCASHARARSSADRSDRLRRAAIILGRRRGDHLAPPPRGDANRPRRVSLARIGLAAAALAGLLGASGARSASARATIRRSGTSGPTPSAWSSDARDGARLLIALAAAAWPAADPCAPPLFRAERKKRSRRLLRQRLLGRCSAASAAVSGAFSERSSRRRPRSPRSERPPRPNRSACDSSGDGASSPDKTRDLKARPRPR